MSEGEPFHPLASDEVRVPIAAASFPSQAPQQGKEKDEDVLSACKSIPSSLGSPGSSTRDPAQELGSEEEEQVPYPALASTVFFCLKQTTRPRSWCLRLVCNPYPFPSRPKAW
uniref:Voltage-dependent T-type calcium channel subunit alpha-1H n=1 Tax=Sphenodon punctatus TaxID=8508 RepID=A0A8D0GC41_SPHPU